MVNTRENPFLYLGASPRASLALLTASKGFAAINGRDFVTPDDIKEHGSSSIKAQGYCNSGERNGRSWCRRGN